MQDKDFQNGKLRKWYKCYYALYVLLYMAWYMKGKKIDRLFFNRGKILDSILDWPFVSPFLFMTLHEDERYLKRLFHFALLLTGMNSHNFRVSSFLEILAELIFSGLDTLDLVLCIYLNFPHFLSLFWVRIPTRPWLVYFHWAIA